MTADERKRLRELAEKRTKVVAWYAHDGTTREKTATVRGPFGRWFVVSGGDDYPTSVSDVYDDAKFAAAAMNSLVPLLDELDRIDEEYRQLKVAFSTAVKAIPSESQGHAQDMNALRAELEEYKTLHRKCVGLVMPGEVDSSDAYMKILRELRAENEAIRAENQRLRAVVTYLD